MTKTFRLGALLLALLASAAGNAAGLGKLTVKSALGQPLRAEIELLSARADELVSMEARLAAPERFEQARMARGGAHESLRFSIDKRADGTPFLRLVSLTPINEPVLDVLVELSWNAGRLVRDYTILLDPPGRPAPASAALSAPAVTAAAAPLAPSSAVVPPQYGPVKSGETLHGIAGKLRHEGVTLDMMVAGLYQANRGAFVGDNMNQLMHGSQLTVPDADSVVRQFSPAQASRLRREHAAAWEAYRVRLADQAGQQVLPDAVRPDAGRIETAARPAVPAAVAGGQDVLRLSKGALDRTADSEALQRIQALEEELLARGRALEDATGRIAQLERTVRDLQRLMVLQGAPVADEPAADGTAPVQVIPPAPVEAPAQLPAPLTPPAAESGWLSEFMQSPLRLAGLGLAALLLGVWFILNLRKRRRPALDLPAASLEPAAPFRATDDGDDASAGAEGPMTEPSRLDLGAIDTSEVDPLAEADVYLAYGRDAQAEEILKAAALRDPARHEIQLKLLGIYAGRLDRSAFEERARVLRASLGEPSGAIWLKAAEMGRGLDPANPLYALPAAVSMGAPGDTIEFEPEPLPAARPAALDLSAIDLELKMPSITEPISPSEPASPAETIEPLAGGSGGARADIKLDLAKAYFEMGDVGGALEILREVVVEGDARQRAEAQALLDARS